MKLEEISQCKDKERRAREGKGYASQGCSSFTCQSAIWIRGRSGQHLRFPTWKNRNGGAAQNKTLVETRHTHASPPMPQTHHTSLTVSSVYLKQLAARLFVGSRKIPAMRLWHPLARTTRPGISNTLLKQQLLEEQSDVDSGILSLLTRTSHWTKLK